MFSAVESYCQVLEGKQEQYLQPVMFGAWELCNPIANNSKISEPYLALNSVIYEIGILALSSNNKVK